MVGAVDETAILDRDAHPYVRRPRQILREGLKPLRSLGENLEDVPFSALHHVKDLRDVFGGDLLVEQVAHRVHEDRARSPPAQRDLETLRPKS